MNFQSFNNNKKVFYWTHRLYIVYYILLIIHCTNYWKWFIAPFIFLAIEMVGRYWHLKLFGRGTKTFVKDVILLPSQVTQLIIPREKSFRFKAGDYIFIKIPAIATNEFHPFTVIYFKNIFF